MIISVASGKGGTGKTLVATSLALSLDAEAGVRFLDCDVEEPSAHIFLRPTIERKEAVSIPVPQVDECRCTLWQMHRCITAGHRVRTIRGA